jgi:hypothetical protein
MAKEKVYSEVLNLRIDEAMGREIKRIAKYRDLGSDSETARLLIDWGIAAHRDMEAKLLRRPYDRDEEEWPTQMVIGVWWEQWDPDDPDGWR